MNFLFVIYCFTLFSLSVYVLVGLCMYCRMEVEEAMDQGSGGGIRMRSTRIKKERPSASTTSRGDAPG